MERIKASHYIMADIVLIILGFLMASNIYADSNQDDHIVHLDLPSWYKPSEHELYIDGSKFEYKAGQKNVPIEGAVVEANIEVYDRKTGILLSDKTDYPHSFFLNNLKPTHWDVGVELGNMKDLSGTKWKQHLMDSQGSTSSIRAGYWFNEWGCFLTYDQNNRSKYFFGSTISSSYTADYFFLNASYRFNFFRHRKNNYFRKIDYQLFLGIGTASYNLKLQDSLISVEDHDSSMAYHSSLMARFPIKNNFYLNIRSGAHWGTIKFSKVNFKTSAAQVFLNFGGGYGF